MMVSNERRFRNITIGKKASEEITNWMQKFKVKYETFDKVLKKAGFKGPYKITRKWNTGRDFNVVTPNLRIHMSLFENYVDFSYIIDSKEYVQIYEIGYKGTMKYMWLQSEDHEFFKGLDIDDESKEFIKRWMRSLNIGLNLKFKSFARILRQMELNGPFVIRKYQNCLDIKTADKKEYRLELLVNNPSRLVLRYSIEGERYYRLYYFHNKFYYKWRYSYDEHMLYNMRATHKEHLKEWITKTGIKCRRIAEAFYKLGVPEGKLLVWHTEKWTTVEVLPSSEDVKYVMEYMNPSLIGIREEPSQINVKRFARSFPEELLDEKNFIVSMAGKIFSA